MWFVIGETRYSEEYAGWGETPDEAFNCLSDYGDPEMDTLQWFHSEKSARVTVIPNYKFEVME